MKKLMYVFAPVLMMVLFVQCKKDDIAIGDQLIADIQTATDKVNIEPEDLPTAAQLVIEEQYFDTYVETVAYAPGKGYEVLLGSEDALYFREDGYELRGTLRGPHRPGPCGRGIPVSVEDLPDAIVAYVTNNYPDKEILRAKQFPKGYVLLIGGGGLLIFNNAYDFVIATRVFHFCDQVGHPIDIANLSDAITDYITDNYPGAEIAKAYVVRGRIVVGLSTPDGRKIVVFDMDGNFLFERG
jgi:hypothetical protein